MHINFKKVFITCALVTTFPPIFTYAATPSNMLTFTGSVIDSACTVTINNGTNTVPLGSTVAKDIAAAGQTGAPKTFDIELTGCPVAGAGVPTKAYVKFSGTTDGDNSYFKNSITGATAATNVAIILKDATGAAIQNNDANTAFDLPAAGGDITAAYTASMIATAALPTKGDVSTSVTYTVSYE